MMEIVGSRQMLARADLAAGIIGSRIPRQMALHSINLQSMLTAPYGSKGLGNGAVYRECSVDGSWKMYANEVEAIEADFDDAVSTVRTSTL